MEKEEKRWLAILTVIALTFNIITVSPLIPWQAWRLWSPPTPSEEFHIKISNYEFTLPSEGITVKVGEPVKFIATSDDVTYGFGVFHKDGRMIFQMQVLPKWSNEIIWVFDEPGAYTIRSTEYSGPNHPYMVLPNAIQVVE